jgi:hypothetical protein
LIYFARLEAFLKEFSTSRGVLVFPRVASMPIGGRVELLSTLTTGDGNFTHQVRICPF